MGRKYSKARRDTRAMTQDPPRQRSLSSSSFAWSRRKIERDLVCRKDAKPMQTKMHSIANKDNKYQSIIEAATLQRILKLQAQQKGLMGSSSHHS